MSERNNWFPRSSTRLYRLALESIEPDRSLYLAVLVDAYETFFQYEFTQIAIQRYQVLIIVYDPANEVIVQWKK